MDKVIRFKTTFGELKGCLHPDNANRIGIIEIKAPSNIEDLKKDPYELTRYIETITKLFVFNQEIIIKNFDNFKDNTEG